MKEEFEITLHAPRLPGVGSALVKISPIVADFRPVAPWSNDRQLRWVGWGLKADGLLWCAWRRSEAEEEEQGRREEEAETKRRESVGGVSREPREKGGC